MKAAWKLVLGGLFAAICFMAFGVDDARAQCCAPPPPCCAPPAPPPCCTPPSPPTPPSNNCCSPPGHSINVPGVNVFVGSTVVVNAQTNATVSAAGASQAAARGQSFVFVGGGGGFSGGIQPQPVGVIQGLNVEGSKEKRRVAYEASRKKVIKVVIQAVCLDDKDVPHPASQIFPERDVEQDYEGELYRCIAGTRMQWVMAEFLDKVSFDGGKTTTCQKGDALYRTKDGEVACRKQKPARDCNERSLLRRFGAGVKVLTMVIVEKYTAYREEEVESSSSSIGAMTLTGGVGGIAF